MIGADRALYANHRRFLEAQRGALTTHDGFDIIHGDVPAFQIALLHKAGVVQSARVQAAFIFAPPWADPGVEAAASRAYQLTHMSLPSRAIPAGLPVDGLTVERVVDEAGLRAFTEIQTVGFAPDAAGHDELFAWMWDKNQRAFPMRDQHYYILRRVGEAVSVLLTVDTGNALGIYAVATPRALRKQGLSSHLLGHVCAAATGKHICLQVIRGSDAERLYTKLGFVERFVVNVYKTQ